MPNAGRTQIGQPETGRAPIGRLKKRPEFLKVAAAREKSVTPGLILQARRRPHSAAPEETGAALRVGFTVSRKVGNAVQRNRARRRLRAVAREVLPACGRAGVDYVLIGRRETLVRPYAALSEDLRQALRRLDKAPRRRARGKRSG